MLQEEGGVEPPNSDATAQQPTGLTLAEYAAAKQLPLEFLQQLGLSDSKWAGRWRVQFPYYNELGEETVVRYRHKMERDGRFSWKKGAKPVLYGLFRLDKARAAKYVVLVEGESDAQTLWYHDIPALGIPGADTWKSEWAKHVDDIEAIYVVLEPDKGGESVKKWLGQALFRDRVRIIQFDRVKDVSALYLSDPAGFKENWYEATKAAILWTEREQQEQNQQANEAWDQCKQLAEDPKILERFVNHIGGRGLAGEERAAKMLYLIVTTRFLLRQVNAKVNGPSAAGKSYTVERVLRYFPPSAYYELSAMSEKALIYLDEPMQHRYLVVYEAAGISSDLLSYLIRSLLSEGRIRYVTVEKVGDQFQSREIVLEGPTGFLTTTTRVSLHPENETRMVPIPINDTPAQTERVMYALALDAEEGTPEADSQEDLEPWHALQRWLEGAEHRVVIPFASALAEYIRPVAVRLRRDLTTVFNLIRAHAILNQANRDRDPSGQIIATNEDYAEVHELIADLIGEGVEMSVPDTVRETVAAVKELLKGKAYGSVAYTEVAKYLGLETSTAKRRAYQAVKAGYLINDETRKGRTAQLILGDDLPEEQVVLPPPEALQVKGFAMTGCTVADDSRGYTPSSSIDEWEYFEL